MSDTMSDDQTTQDDAARDAASASPAAAKILDAALAHVPFDGWSEATLRAAASDAGVSIGLARALFPRGAVDLALAYHARGDAAMKAAYATLDLSDLRYSERVARCILLRLEQSDKELVRRGATLFALPQNTADGARAVWQSADAIWTALGDTSDDVNWYTKRATLSGVYSASVLYWLGDDSLDHHATKDFVDRRIANVMAFEKAKGRVANSALGQALAKGPLSVFARVKAPGARDGMPGSTGGH